MSDDVTEGKSAQDAAIDEAEGLETVTFTWDDDEWTAPTYDALTADQLAAVEDYSDNPISVRNCRNLLLQVLGVEQAGAFNWTGRTRAEDILLTTANVFKALAEDGWGLGKPSNRRERRSQRITKR